MFQARPITGGSEANARGGLVLVLSGPSGSGKTALAEALLAWQAGSLIRSVSVTTRPPRPGEACGVDYHFVSDDHFEGMARAGEFVEDSVIYGHRYGTLHLPIERALQRGQDVLCVLDAKGRAQLAGVFANVVSVFVMPPSLHELERRLRLRGHEALPALALRLQAAQAEIAAGADCDFRLVNDDFKAAAARLEMILRGLRPQPDSCGDLAGGSSGGRSAPSGKPAGIVDVNALAGYPVAHD